MIVLTFLITTILLSNNSDADTNTSVNSQDEENFNDYSFAKFQHVEISNTLTPWISIDYYWLDRFTKTVEEIMCYNKEMEIYIANKKDVLIMRHDIRTYFPNIFVDFDYLIKKCIDEEREFFDVVNEHIRKNVIKNNQEYKYDNGIDAEVEELVQSLKAENDKFMLDIKPYSDYEILFKVKVVRYRIKDYNNEFYDIQNPWSIAGPNIEVNLKKKLEVLFGNINDIKMASFLWAERDKIALKMG